MYYERILVIDPKASSEGASLLSDQFLQLSHLLSLLLQDSGYYNHKFDGVGDKSDEIWMVHIIDSSILISIIIWQ